MTNSELDYGAIEQLQEKARKYDEIEAKITSFYNYDEEEKEDMEYDLCDIGEYIASYFGYL